MHEAEVPGKRITDCILNTIPSSANLLIDTTVGDEDSVLGHLTLLLSKELGVVGPRGKDKVRDDSDKDRSNALNEEEPLPSVHAGNAIHVLENTSSQETRDDVGDCVAGVPDCHPEGTLFFGVPAGCHKGQTGEERSFHQANEESNSAETGAAGHGGHADGARAPHEHDCGEEEFGVGLGHEEIAGELANEITNVECGDARVPDGIVHLEIFLETSKTSIGNIDAIKVAEGVSSCYPLLGRLFDLLHQEHESNTRHHVPINLAANSLVQLIHALLREIPEKRKSSLNLSGRNGADAGNSVLDAGHLGLLVHGLIALNAVVA